MSAGSIKAGKAVIEISVLDRVKSGLERVQQRLSAWAAGLATWSGRISAVGVGILAPLLGAASHFSAAGSSLADMAARTGESTDSLQALGFAADMTGSSINDVEASVRKLSQFSAKLATGNAKATQTLDQLGISAADFAAANTDEKLALLADALAKIDDPSQRAALAMQVLGKSGTKLLPMLSGGAEGLNQFLARAKELNIILTPEQIQKADALGDAWDELGKQLSAVASNIGSALADALTSLIGQVQTILSEVIDFVKNNEALIVSIASLAAGLVAAGAVLLTVSGLVFGLGAVLESLFTIGTAVSALLASMSAALGFLLTPIGAVTAAIVVLVAGYLTLTTAGNELVSGVSQQFSEMFDLARDALAGIYDALISGNWSLAGEIAMQALYLAFAQGWQNITALFIQQITSLTTMLYTRVGKAVAELGKFIGSEALQDVGKAIKTGAVVAKSGIMLGTSIDTPEIKKMQEDFNRLLDQAAAEKQALIDKRLAKSRDKFAGVQNTLPKNDQLLQGEPTSTLGTFSSFVTGLLGRSGALESHAAKTAENTEKTAENTEKAVEALDEMNDKLDDLELEFS